MGERSEWFGKTPFVFLKLIVLQRGRQFSAGLSAAWLEAGPQVQLQTARRVLAGGLSE
jgi:hypothetical protein